MFGCAHPNRRHQYPALPPDRRPQFGNPRRVAFHEFDEHHVHVVEIKFAEPLMLQNIPNCAVFYALATRADAPTLVNVFRTLTDL